MPIKPSEKPMLGFVIWKDKQVSYPKEEDGEAAKAVGRQRSKEAKSNDASIRLRWEHWQQSVDNGEGAQ